jgi:hypothetical protein
MGTFSDFLRAFLIFSVTIIFPAAIICKFFLIKRKNIEKHPTLDQEPWAFGDEWQKTEEVDMTDWEEIMTVPQDYYKTHLYNFGSEIMKLKKTDLGKGMEHPVYYYLSSIAPSGLTMYKGNIYSEALALTHLNRLVMNGTKVMREERLL